MFKKLFLLLMATALIFAVTNCNKGSDAATATSYGDLPSQLATDAY